MLCLVCHSQSARNHFGALVCRACAAFFRRYVHSKRIASSCKCGIINELCRFCRMKKCVAIGMQKDKVQIRRDVNIQGVAREIKLRNFHHLARTTARYNVLESQRELVFGADNTAKSVNLYEFSTELKIDAKLVWKLCETAFPVFDRLDRSSKKTLFYNFHAKWNVLETSVFSMRRDSTVPKFISPSGAEATSIGEFYAQMLRNGERMEREMVERIFQPYWTWHLERAIRPLSMLKFDRIEYMALLGILLWDGGYSNLSPELSETCRSMRKIIFQELSSYYDERKETDASDNMFRALETLQILEHAQQKWQEEMHMCALYGLKVDEEHKNLILWDRM